MRITNKEVEQIAFQSRLELTTDEQKDYAESLNEVLAYLDIVNKIDTSTVEPAGHVLPIKNVF
ncbi:MAG: Asp-tRNA(Asn)/Glu-tRNA(Gln) amidotransferase subunit GatC, partial [Bacillota bacterium]|nr:Asp-tRNA(Asn)/Glu-tRNA(Gln) amidotransferase subunit GatC [Bacillota bacterium]